MPSISKASPEYLAKLNKFDFLSSLFFGFFIYNSLA
jgi:hypothetical protein